MAQPSLPLRNVENIGVAQMSKASDVAYWIDERERIRIAKEAGKPRPWTKDPILATYRFCNVRREDDAVTRWIAKNWRDPYVGHPNHTRAVLLARLINWPPTLHKIGFPETWNPNYIINMMQACEAQGKAWSSAYIVSTNGNAINKALYVVRDVATPLGNSPIPANSLRYLQASHRALMRYNGLGSFMAAQVIADLKNTPGHPLAEAEDWGIWAAPGPGSLRGLRYFFGGSLPHNFLYSLDAMIEEVYPLVESEVKDRMCMQDWQNVMCEMSKYWRAKNGTGRPKSHYHPNPAFA